MHPARRCSSVRPGRRGGARWSRSRARRRPPRSRPRRVAVDAGPGLVLALAGGPAARGGPAHARRLRGAGRGGAGARPAGDSRRRRRPAARERRGAHRAARGGVARPAHPARGHQGQRRHAARHRSWSLDRRGPRRRCSHNAETQPTGSTRCSRTCSTCRGCRPGRCAPCSSPAALDEVVHRPCAGVPDGHRGRSRPATGRPLILTDAGLLERVVANLVENAVRHSPVATARPARRGDRRRAVWSCGSSIADPACREAGNGLRMFEAFQRLGDSPDRRRGRARPRGRAGARRGGRCDDRGRGHPGGGLTMVVAVPLAGPAAARTVAR